MQDKINETYNTIAMSEGLLPIKVTSFYKKKIKEENEVLGHLGPLYRVSLPTKERISLKAPNEVDDFVDDRSNKLGSTRTAAIIKKYTERILLLTTSRCFGHCQYCFRTSLLTGGAATGGQEAETAYLAHLLEILRANSSITEVILSGGDPLTLPQPRLETIVEGIFSVPTVKSIRVHTRSIVYEPTAFNAEKVAL